MKKECEIECKPKKRSFLVMLVALHFTPVSGWIGGIVWKSDFASRNRFFGEYFSEFSGIFFRVFVYFSESSCFIFSSSWFTEYFPKFWVCFRIFEPKLSEDLLFFFFFFSGLTGTSRIFSNYFRIFLKKSKILTFEVFFRILIIFRILPEKKAGAGFLGSRVFLTMLGGS